MRQTAVILDNTPLFQYFHHINALLECAVAVCRGTAIANSMATLTLEKKESFAPGETKQLQWRLRKLLGLLEETTVN